MTRPDFDRLDELYRDAKAALSHLSAHGLIPFEREIVAAYPSIRDYVKELEEFYADALKGIRDGEADQVRIERLREALEHVVDETRNPWAIARDALAADKEAGDGD